MRLAVLKEIRKKKIEFKQPQNWGGLGGNKRAHHTDNDAENFTVVAQMPFKHPARHLGKADDALIYLKINRWSCNVAFIVIPHQKKKKGESVQFQNNCHPPVWNATACTLSAECILANHRLFVLCIQSNRGGRSQFARATRAAVGEQTGQLPCIYR